MSNNQESDFGTIETQKQAGGITKGYNADGGKVARVNHQAPFDVLYHRGSIGDNQWEAGERLRRDAQASGKFAFVKSSADFSIKGSMTEQAADYITAASERFNKAIAALSQEERAVVILIVLDEGYIKYITNRDIRYRGMMILRDGLDTLAKFYGV